MKEFILLAIILAGAILASANDSIPKPQYKLEGNNVTLVSKATKSTHDSNTIYTFTNTSGIKIPVYKGKSGGYYIWVTSKKGNPYRKYIKF